MPNDKLIQFKGTIYENGYGLIAKKIIKDSDLSISAKALYSYLCAYAGSQSTAFPSVKLINHELGISKDTFYKYMKELTDKAYIIVTHERAEKGKFSHNIYSIEAVPCPKLPDTVLRDTVPPDTEFQDTTSNSSTSNSSTSNNSSSKKESKKSTTYDEVINAYTINAELKNALIEFIKMRKLIKSPLTDRALQLLLKTLDKLADNDTKKVAILEQSIMNNWKSVYAPKNDGKNIQTPKIDSFNNFQGRNYSEDQMTDIEKKLLGWREHCDE